MVRVKEIKDKLRPNASFRAWQASHTFGGTTKTKSLYIAGFRRKNFYYVAGMTAATLLIGGISGGVSVRNSVQNAENRGQLEGAFGQLVETKITQSRTRTLTSDGIILLTTEITSFATTVQRGGGTTLVKTTGADGEIITLPGAITFVTNSDNKVQQKTLVGSTFIVTETDGLTVPTTLFGVVTTVTDTNGDDTTITAFSELTVVTGVDGGVSTSLRGQSSSEATSTTSGQTVLSTQIGEFTSTKTDGEVITGMTTNVDTMISSKTTSVTSATITTSTRSSTESSSSSTSITSPPPSSSSTTKASPQSSSSSKSTSSSASGGGGSGGGGDLFAGEGTFYTPGLGSCGIDSTEADFVAALSKVLFDSTGVANSNNNPYCGRKALVKAAGGSRKQVFQRETSTQTDVTKMIWYTGNITLGRGEIWGESRSQKHSRRYRISSEMGKGQVMQEYPPHPSPLGEHTLLSLTTQVIVGDASSVGSLQPVITPPPLVYNKDLENRQAGGGGVTVTIVDRCPVCAQYDLDLSPAAFDVIGNEDAGRVEIEWSWLD